MEYSLLFRSHVAVESPACENEEASMSLSTQNSRSDLTSVCSQPLKNLARQLQVSSSFRVEKKISQASEELGLFPLTLYLNHLSHRPEKPLIHLAEKPHASPIREFVSSVSPIFCETFIFVKMKRGLLLL